MSENNFGEMVWMDLTVPEASKVSNFYHKVLGWSSVDVPMNKGEYNDFAMSSPNEKTVTGICHAKGPNADMPAVWLPYFLVEDIEQAVETVIGQGGSLATEIKSMGDDKYTVIKDPSGAMCALYQKSA